MKTTIKVIHQDCPLEITFPTGRISTALKYLKASLTDFTIVTVKKQTV